MILSPLLPLLADFGCLGSHRLGDVIGRCLADVTVRNEACEYLFEDLATLGKVRSFLACAFIISRLRKRSTTGDGACRKRACHQHQGGQHCGQGPFQGFSSFSTFLPSIGGDDDASLSVV
jgi:hypothetical protein